MAKNIKTTSQQNSEIPFEDFTIEKFYECYKATKNSDTKKEFVLGIPEMYNFIRNNLNDFKYYPQPYNCFLVSEPKPREIFAPHFIDRIIQHYIVEKIKNIENNFIEDSYANRKNKGTHKAILKTQKYMRQLPQKDTYYLQCDIKSFFLSINKNIMWKILEKQIKKLNFSEKEYKKITYILNRILYQDVTHKVKLTGNKEMLKLIPKNKSMFYQKKHNGIPIGSLTSQLFSAIYLNELDHFIKDKLKSLVRMYYNTNNSWTSTANSSNNHYNWNGSNTNNKRNSKFNNIKFINTRSSYP